jgi:ATP-dependent Clp protease ATP-binding subunit ClpX
MKPRNAYCSFCRKGLPDAGPLVEGPDGVYICGECVELCQSIIEQEQRRRNPAPRAVTPAQVRERLDQLVTGQAEAKQALALAAGSRDDGGGRALLIGPSRGTQLLLARAVAHVLEAPFASGDSSGLVQSVQGSADGLPLLFRLLDASDFDVEAAQRGVVFVDGVDRPDAQHALLRLWQEGTCRLAEGLQLAVRGILFVCGGTFAGLDEATARLGRHPEQPVGVEELMAVGVRSDWAACLTGIARVGPLDEESLVRIVQWVDFRCYTGERAEEAPVGGDRDPGFSEFHDT